MRHEAEMKAILKQVELWPQEERNLLAAELMAGTAGQASSSDESFPVRKLSIDDLVGIANPSGKSFTDEEVDQLRFEALSEKYLK